MTIGQKQWMLNLATAIVLGMMLLSYGVSASRKYTREYTRVYVDKRLQTYDSTVMSGVIIPMYDTIISQQHNIIMLINERGIRKIAD